MKKGRAFFLETARRKLLRIDLRGISPQISVAGAASVREYRAYISLAHIAVFPNERSSFSASGVSALHASVNGSEPKSRISLATASAETGCIVKRGVALAVRVFAVLRKCFEHGEPYPFAPFEREVQHQRVARFLFLFSENFLSALRIDQKKCQYAYGERKQRCKGNGNARTHPIIPQQPER